MFSTSKEKWRHLTNYFLLLKYRHHANYLSTLKVQTSYKVFIYFKSADIIQIIFYVLHVLLLEKSNIYRYVLTSFKLFSTWRTFNSFLLIFIFIFYVNIQIWRLITKVGMIVMIRKKRNTFFSLLSFYSITTLPSSSRYHM